MSLIHKSRACILTFILIISSLSIILTSSTGVFAEDIPEESIDEILQYLKLYHS